MEDDEASSAASELSAASRYNRSLESHFGVDVGLAEASTPLLDREGAPLGPKVTPYRPGKKIRIQGNEIVRRAGKEALYYMWGDGDVESGFVPHHALDSAPDLREDDGGNGEVAPSNCRSYVVRPTAIPTDLRFHRFDGKSPSTLATYGTPAAPAFPDYTSLQWNVVSVQGGGLVRSILREGEIFYASKVARITVTSVASPGSVTFMYGFAFQGEKRVYGWTVVSHLATGARTYHVDLRSTTDCK